MKWDTEVVYMILELVSKKAMSLNDFVEEIPFDKKSITGVLFALTSAGFLEKETINDKKEGAPKFFVTASITAYHIIKLGELGIDINTLNSLVKISSKQKQAALTLALQSEKVAEMDELARKKRLESAVKNKEKTILPRDSVVDVLEKLALASDLSIEEMKKTNKNKEIINALKEAKEQALKALNSYQEQLKNSGPDHLGF